RHPGPPSVHQSPAVGPGHASGWHVVALLLDCSNRNDIPLRRFPRTRCREAAARTRRETGMTIHQGAAEREEALFREAIAIANVPTLLMVLVQMTGDMRWLGEEYRPARGQGLGDNDS